MRHACCSFRESQGVDLGIPDFHADANPHASECGHLGGHALCDVGCQGRALSQGAAGFVQDRDPHRAAVVDIGSQPEGLAIAENRFRDQHRRLAGIPGHVARPAVGPQGGQAQPAVIPVVRFLLPGVIDPDLVLEHHRTRRGVDTAPVDIADGVRQRDERLAPVNPPPDLRVRAPGQFGCHAAMQFAGGVEDRDQAEIDIGIAKHGHRIGLCLDRSTQHLDRLGPLDEVPALHRSTVRIPGGGYSRVKATYFFRSGAHRALLCVSPRASAMGNRFPQRMPSTENAASRRP